MKAGLSPTEASKGLVPSLERPADLPQFGQDAPLPTTPVTPMPQSIVQPNQPLAAQLQEIPVQPQMEQLLTNPPPERLNVPSGDELDP